MKRNSLDIYIQRPEEMVSYLANYGWSFNKKLCDVAVKKMRRKNAATGKKEPIEPFTKEQVENLLTRYNIVVENNTLYDMVYVANMCKADFYNSSVIDEQHLAMFVKDVIDDPDAPQGFIMRRWYSDMIAKGEPIDWSEVI